MFRRFSRTKERVVEFCDRCAQVCDPGCRAAALREQARLQVLRLGWRI